MATKIIGSAADCGCGCGCEAYPGGFYARIVSDPATSVGLTPGFYLEMVRYVDDYEEDADFFHSGHATGITNVLSTQTGFNCDFLDSQNRPAGHFAWAPSSGSSPINPATGAVHGTVIITMLNGCVYGYEGNAQWYQTSSSPNPFIAFFVGNLN